MLSKVKEDVDEAVAHFSRRLQRARMIAIAPDRSAAAPGAVESAGGPARQAVEAAAQLIAAVSFNDQVNVIGLDGEVNDTKAAAIRRREGLQKRRERNVGSQRLQPAHRPQHDVDRMARIVRGARGVGNVGSRLGSPSSRARPPPAPSARFGQRKLFGQPSCHLDSAPFSAVPRDGCVEPMCTWCGNRCAILIRHPFRPYELVTRRRRTHP